MSRFAEVIVIAQEAEEVMRPLTLPDRERAWHECFQPITQRQFEGSEHGSESCFMWVAQFQRLTWLGLLPHLESLRWPRPHSVQVLIHDEEDDCFGLWMIYDDRLTEVPLPRTTRSPFPGESVTGLLLRSDARAELTIAACAVIAAGHRAIGQSGRITA